MTAKGDLSHDLVCQLVAGDLPEPALEYLFAPEVDGKPIRRWRFDAAWPDRRIALEIDGSVFTGGRHGGQRSAVRDIEKRAAAAVLGWRVIPVTPQQVSNGTALRYVRAAMNGGEWPFEARP